MADARYKIVAHDGGAYIIHEYHSFFPVFEYRGFLRGNVFKLYPLRSMLRGERRTARTVSVSEVSAK